MWDMAYNPNTFIVGCWLGLNICVFKPMCSKCGYADRWKLSPIVWLVCLVESILVKQVHMRSGFSYGFWAWPLCTCVIVFSCTRGMVFVLPYVFRQYQAWEANKFFLFTWVFSFAMICWHLALYYHNQVYVLEYNKGRDMNLASSYMKYCANRDFCMAAFFIGGSETQGNVITGCWLIFADICVAVRAC